MMIQIYLVSVMFLATPSSSLSLTCKEDIGHSNCDLLPDDVKCGISSPYDDTPRTLGGHDARRNEYPWMACLKRDSPSRICFCGGVLISKLHVLTAAHCMNFTVVGRNFLVVLGEHDTRVDPDCNRLTGQCSAPAQKFHAQKIFVHDQYWSFAEHGIALLKLNKEVEVNRYAQPICLPFRDLTNTDNIAVKAIGWGMKLNNKLHPQQYILQEADFKTIPLEECKKMPAIYPIEDSHICVRTSTRHTPTPGDSGGPLMGYKVLDTGSVRFSLLGLDSYKRSAKNIHSEIYTRVSTYIPWILDKM